jgi:bifunctional non-homologous end joining protein LigD
MSPAVTHPDKMLWPLVGFTKGQLLHYYERIALVITPHLRDRPLTLGRFPDGIESRGFAQLECRGRPEWVRTAAVQLRDGRVRRMCLVDGLESLLWVANLNTIELHVFLGTASSLSQPTGVLFDLDPEPPAGFADASRVALALRERLSALGLAAIVKTTGGSGLHVLVPLNSPHSYAQTRAFARRVAADLAASDERIASRAARRSTRRGQVLVDWAQNNERRTLVAPYSLRAADVPLVSAPVLWSELEAGEQLWFGPGEVLERVERMGDLFAPALNVEQRLPQ